MKLKMIIAYLIGTALMVHAGFCAEPPATKNNRIGYLSASAINETFRQGLRDLGYIEGQNLVFEYRQAQTTEQYAALAEELVRLKVDLILAVGVAAVRESGKATHTIPIVMGNSSADPVRLGLIKSLARPGGNVTGVFDLLPNLAGKRIALLKELYPKLSRVAHIAPNSPGRNTVGPAHLEATVAAARSLGVTVQDVKVARPEDLEETFRMLADSGTEAAVLVGVSFFIPHRNRIIQLAAKYRLPTIYTHLRWVSSGGFIAYTTDSDVRYRRAAEIVDQIFKGRKPADIPAEQPTKFVLEVNLKTAKALGVSVPQSILLRANRVVE